MSTAYEAWQETRAHLREEPDSTYLQRVEESLRPAALLGYLDENCRRFDSERYDPEDRATAADVREFLAGLDELRAPTAAQRSAQTEGMRVLVRKTLQDMHKLNWTGDHTYGDALDDAFQVLNHVLAGNNNWPRLERFRCPSLYGKGANQVRCQHQLPHESGHHWESEGKGVDWTDEQSGNPPKSYDEPATCGQRFRGNEYEETCQLPEHHELPHRGTKITWTSSNSWNPILTEQQLDKLAAEVFGPEITCNAEHDGLVCTLPKKHDGQHFDARDQEYWGLKAGNPDPINRPKAEDTDGECGAKNPAASALKEPTCVRPKQHAGLHRDAAGMRWGR